jgi:serine/threonine protein kinase
MQKQSGTLAASVSADNMARALEEYLAAAEAGAAPPREEFLARHPELAADLDACLAALRFIGLAAEGPRSVVAGVAGAHAPEQASGLLGDFRLIREVGRGGMGVVYEAEQVSLRRRVALKVLPFAATMDPRQLQRFHNEARAAASLDHPNIVHVYAVGCERAVHFYAMQFIEGQTLAALIAGLRPDGGQPVAANGPQTTPYLSRLLAPAADTAPRAVASTIRAPRDQAHFRRMTELGILAAVALDHAHTLGIVHRDVKPANLLVDGRGGLWVTDLGLAHIQSDARLTMTGDLVGTLRYMSPEQALAKRVVVDHRTDIYSLGATLYELFTLEPVFSGGDRQELLRQIAFDEPRPPRRINKAIPPDLETIVLKAMEKNPSDRYATANELADDLRRFLADEPILARPAGVARRLRKWGQRYWQLVGAAMVLMALAVAGLATSTAMIWAEQSNTEIARKDAVEKTELAENREREAKAQQRRAEDNLRTALELIETLREILVSIKNNPQSGYGPEEVASWTGQLVTVLEKMRNDRLQDPEYLERLARAHWNFGDVLAQLGRFAEAEASYREAMTLYVGVVADFPAYPNAFALRTFTPDIYMNLADVQRAIGLLAEAEDSYDQAERLFGSLNFAKGDQGPEGEILCGRARCQLAAGHVAEAEILYRQALHISPRKNKVLEGWAWFLATRPDAEHRDPAEAIKVLNRVQGGETDFGEVVLGVAQYGSGNWNKARAILGRDAQLRGGESDNGGAVNGRVGKENGADFFLAMTLWQLGEKDKALERYKAGLAWTDKYRPNDKELLRFRADAARLLGANAKPEMTTP